MTASIHDALSAVNRRFYERHAESFSATRESPWTGWERVIEVASEPSREPASDETSDSGAAAPIATEVLDAGCGNARFGLYLARRWHRPIQYLGVDGCEALLQAAALRLEEAGIQGGFELRQLDLLDRPSLRALADQRFPLIVAFGVLHHVPGARARRHLIRRLSTLLTPGGILAVSLWRLDQTPRLARLLVPWQDYNRSRVRQGLMPLDLEALEPGDRLLSWGGDPEHPRYCHFPDDAEIDALAAAPAAHPIDRFEADGPSGKDNLYLLWRRI